MLAVLATVLLAVPPLDIGFVGPMSIPVLVSALPLMVRRRRLRRMVQIAAAAGLLTFVLVSILSIGVFYLPSAVAMAVAAALRR